MTELITTLAEVETNSVIFFKSLRNGDKTKKARSMLKNSKFFFVNLSENEWVFAPSRFVGFKNNSIQSHEKGVREKNRDGTKVDSILADMSFKADDLSTLYASLETSFLQFCIAHDTLPSVHPTPRQYWVSLKDVGKLPSNGNSSWEKRANILAKTILQTVKTSGRNTTRTTKSKSTDMNLKQLTELIIQKMKNQKFICNLTGVKMKTTGDSNFYPSPDRIDSNQGYSRENIQIVCQFANKWKSDQPNAEFLELIKAIKNS